ncbi:uncharacterized protein LOC117139318 [Drosophila mauritiana]|uniref:Uncharacterized protein LOC117139318 n=1 Tax=Drosophila mauritiana TaxID=7226 RepID=A0A6P8JNG8_DROMA|nr:uncharacterized protein LOC117139318 [Drosophila mauritiana]
MSTCMYSNKRREASVQCQIAAEGRCRMQCAVFIWFLRLDVYLHLQHEYAAVNVSVSASASPSQTRSHVCVEFWTSVIDSNSMENLTLRQTIRIVVGPRQLDIKHAC